MVGTKALLTANFDHLSGFCYDEVIVIPCVQLLQSDHNLWEFTRPFSLNFFGFSVQNFQMSIYIHLLHLIRENLKIHLKMVPSTPTLAKLPQFVGLLPRVFLDLTILWKCLTRMIRWQAATSKKLHIFRSRHRPNVTKRVEIDWIRGRDFLILSDLDTDLPIVPASEAIAASDVIGPGPEKIRLGWRNYAVLGCWMWIPGLVNVYITMGNHQFFNGKIHDFNWTIFNSKLLVYPEGNCRVPFSWTHREMGKSPQSPTHCACRREWSGCHSGDLPGRWNLEKPWCHVE